MPRFCRFCGEELKNPQARFCPACGEQLPPGKPCPDETVVEERVPASSGVDETVVADLPPAGPPQSPPSFSGAGPSHAPRLVIRVPGESPWEIPLDRTCLTVGRRPDNDVVLSLKYVSGYHGRIEQRGAEWHYVDLGSTNGTFINGQRAQSAVLRDGDILRVGDPQGCRPPMTRNIHQYLDHIIARPRLGVEDEEQQRFVVELAAIDLRGQREEA